MTESSYLTRIGTLIRDARRHQGLTQNELADKLGTSQSAVARIEQGSAEGRLTHAPDNPMADANGMVRMPDLDMGEQMSSLVMAQRGFQANVQVTKTAQDSYASALQIGRA